MSGMRVMVVTEHPVFREILTNIVEERGFEAYPAADGIDALRHIYHVLPRVIVSDAALPNLSGFELLPFIRRRFPEIGVIALSEQRCMSEATAKEFADVILPVDPFNPKLLGDTLSVMMTDCPFRAAQHSDGSTQSRPNRQLAFDTNVCQNCEKLQLNVSIARMNSLLSNVWKQLRPEDIDAENQETDADLRLRDAFTDLDQHQRSVHGLSGSEPLNGSESNKEAQMPSCANG